MCETSAVAVVLAVLGVGMAWVLAAVFCWVKWGRA